MVVVLLLLLLPKHSDYLTDGLARAPGWMVPAQRAQDEGDLAQTLPAALKPKDPHQGHLHHCLAQLKGLLPKLMERQLQSRQARRVVKCVVANSAPPPFPFAHGAHNHTLGARWLR